MAKRIDNVTLQDTDILFKNFSGQNKGFNVNNQRNFCAVLPDDMARQMEADGWNVKYLEPREEGDVRKPIIKVVVKFNAGGPQVVSIGSRGRTLLDEDAVGSLDFMSLGQADMVIRPFQYEHQGRTGVAAYLNKLFVHVNEDALDLKYANVPNAVQHPSTDPWAQDGQPEF